jgi:dihydroorotase
MRKEITLNAPDEWHAHLRFGAVLKAVIYWTVRCFKRLLAMGNVPAVETVEKAQEYKQETNDESMKYGCETIVAPKLTLSTTPEMIEAFFLAGFRILKLYAGITTGSAAGISGFRPLYPSLAVMQDRGMYLCVHMEDADPLIEYDQRERVCLSKLAAVARDFPRLHITIEHISCAETAEFLRYAHFKKMLVAGGVAMHHFKHNKNDVFGNEADPHLIFKPPIQGFRDQREIQKLVMVDKLPNVFMGNDPAPHLSIYKGPGKIRSGGFTGIVTAAEWLRMFLEMSNIDALNNFWWAFGADWYQVPRNKEKLVMVNDPDNRFIVPDEVGGVIPYMAGETVEWDFGAIV